MTVVQSSRELRDGVDALLDRYAGISDRDHCVVVFAPDSREAAAWLVAGLKQRKIDTQAIGMRPLVDYGFAERLKSAVPDPESFTGRLVIFTLERGDRHVSRQDRRPPGGGRSAQLQRHHPDRHPAGGPPADGRHHGRARHGFTGGDDDVRELVEPCYKQPHGTRVGELGFGTNSGIDRFIPANSHINERRVGVHIGFGQHNQDRAVVGYEEKVHLDLVTDGAELHIDDESEPVDLANLRLTGDEHPELVRDEDITGDCCGFGYGELTDPAAASTIG